MVNSWIKVVLLILIGLVDDIVVMLVLICIVYSKFKFFIFNLSGLSCFIDL